MNALVVSGPGVVGVQDVPTPAVEVGHVLIRPLASGLCGTDLEIIDGTLDAAYVRLPLILGHEWVGRRLTAREDNRGEGELVVVEGIIPCGHCAQCRRGATNRCSTYDEIGFTRPGSLAELMAVPEHLVHAMSDGVSPLDAVLVEPMAVVWRALRRAAVPAGARCLVVGDGTVALLCAYLLGRFSPESVTMLGARPAQAELAGRAGVTTFTTRTPGERFDVVVEAAGQIAAVRSALSGVARGGTVILLGLPAHGSVIDVAPDQLVNDDVTLQGSFSYDREAWREVVALLNDATLHPSFVITHRFRFDQWRAAIDSLRSVPDDHPRGKVLITLDPSLG